MGAFNCLHPRSIVTIRGEVIKVRCGHCEACTNMSSLTYTTQCELESQSHRYCMFVTLTYDNQNVPLVRPVYRKSVLSFLPASPRLHAHFATCDRPSFAIAPAVHLDRTTLGMYFSKFALPEYLDGLIPVLDKVDVQHFLKRLRYRIYKTTNEKIRYFACGEYGPVHFRPHYHLQLWFDNPETLAYMGKAISSSWKFGRVDYSLSKGSTSSYVAAYSNSVSSRSRLHGVKYLRPFVLHSTRLFGSIYKSASTALLETTYDELARTSYNRRGRLRTLPPLLAFENQFFGRCVNYDTQNHQQRLVCYCYARKVFAEYGRLSVSKLATLIYNDEDSPCHQLLASLTYDGGFKESTISSVIYRSMRFLRYCDLFNVSEDYMLRFIEKYWRDKDLALLHKQLSEQEEYSAQFGKEWLPYLLSYYGVDPQRTDKPVEYSKPVLDYIASIGLEPQFFTDDCCPVSDNVSYQNFKLLHTKLSRDRVKHKKLNDLNNIFNN